MTFEVGKKYRDKDKPEWTIFIAERRKFLDREPQYLVEYPNGEKGWIGEWVVGAYYIPLETEEVKETQC